MSVKRKFILALTVIALNGCSVPQMSLPSGSNSPSSPSGTQSPSRPSSSSDSPSSSRDSESASNSSDQGVPGEMDSMPPKPKSSSGDADQDSDQGDEDGAGSDSDQGVPGEMDSMPPKPEGNPLDPNAVFNKSLDDFDKEMQGERVMIAAANESLGGMRAQEIADAAAIQQGGLDGPLDMESGESSEMTGSETEGQNQDKDNPETDIDESGSSTPDGDGNSERIPEDIPMDGTGEDVIARQIRQAAVEEDDPIIRAALWDEYRKHMGIKK